MTDLPPARRLLSSPPGDCAGVVVLDYDARLLRRKRLTTQDGDSFLVDLPAVTNLDDFWGFQLEDGRAIQIAPAQEPLVQITGDLPRLAWHIGNRHTPCQVQPTRLLIRRDHVIEAMLAQLGATLAYVVEPFIPEGGAYGSGRTMGHDHGHGHSHSHGHGPAETQAPSFALATPSPSQNAAQDFGWHDHGDGKLHFHAPKR